MQNNSDLLKPWLTPPSELISLYPGPPDLHAQGYSLQTARFAAWCSWLVYQESFDNIRLIIEACGLRLAGEWRQENSEGMLVMPEDESWLSFAFAGSYDLMDWINNIQALPKFFPGGIAIHSGFHSQWERLEASVMQATEAFPDAAIFISGHSLGAATATIAAAYLPRANLYTFAGPSVGNRRFAEKVESNASIYRHVHGRDVVPHLLPMYRHVGELVELDGQGYDAISAHGMRGYFEALTGDDGGK
ncbi:MAG: lipase family protein [Blastocatellia bacterium]|nr:lipase family protein [Blastocatellia bacterium]